MLILKLNCSHTIHALPNKFRVNILNVHAENVMHSTNKCLYFNENERREANSKCICLFLVHIYIWKGVRSVCEMWRAMDRRQKNKKKTKNDTMKPPAHPTTAVTMFMFVDIRI